MYVYLRFSFRFLIQAAHIVELKPSVSKESDVPVQLTVYEANYLKWLIIHTSNFAKISGGGNHGKNATLLFTLKYFVKVDKSRTQLEEDV